MHVFQVLHKHDLIAEDALFVQAPDQETAVQLYAKYYEIEDYLKSDFRVFLMTQVLALEPHLGPKVFAYGVDVLELSC
ncbi:hypothetical protein [Roseibium alexandrii]|uniref:hypothetical protein n=1 Tax=Roseibium alexandrii TaxID=388408 RepID=UPI003753242F